MHSFGFGAPTGANIPGEEDGATLPLDKYSGSSMGNLPIGQGELVTPIQMATLYSAIANGGILRPPHIVGAVGGHTVAEPAGRRVISSSVAAEVREMLKGVLAPGGTASEVSIPGYQLAGKTGTASKIDPETGEYSKSAYVASFVGFAPGVRPEAAVCGDRRRTAGRLDLRRCRRRPGLRPDHGIRAAIPGDPAELRARAGTDQRHPLWR